MAADFQEEILVSFIFNACHTSFSYNYGTPCEQALLEALTLADDNKAIRARVRRGDLLIPRSVESKVDRIVHTPLKKDAGNHPSHPKVHHRHNTRALATTVGDLIDSFNSQWHTLDLTDLAHRIFRTSLYCLSMYPLKAADAALIDSQLQSYDPYIGAVQVDHNSPLHRQIFAGLLDCVYVDRDVLYRSRWDTDEGVYDFGETPERFFKVQELTYFDFLSAAPNFPKFQALSNRAAQSIHRLNAATKPSHFDRIASRILREIQSGSMLHPIDFKVIPPEEEQLKIPVEKLLNYALNTKHEVGQHKAKLFADKLGIVADNWRFLAYQLKLGSNGGEIENLQVNEHGVKYSVNVQVVGLNEKVCTVKTAWIVRHGFPAQLTTTYPADKSKQKADTVVPPPWISPFLKGEDRWRELHVRAVHAAETAVASCVPTPMFIEGSEVVLDGYCGGAYIKLDGRSSFARWLISQNLGMRVSGSGVRYYANVNTQSMDKAYAYAEAYNRVLWLNGLDNTFAMMYID